MALNCLVFEKIAFLQFGDRHTDKQTDRQTDRQTNRLTLTRPSYEAALAVASGGLKSKVMSLAIRQRSGS